MSRFTELTDRTGTRSVKWDMAASLFQSESILPMWVADMDFKAPESVIDALTERAAHGIFGYTMTDKLIEGYISEWLRKRHSWSINEEWLTYSPGVIPSLHMMVQALTEKDDHILIQTPVYPPFYSVIKQHDRNIIENPLMLKGERYEIDFEDFENKIVKNNVKAFILCNPHNPVGRVWDKSELEEMAQICLKHDVLIFSDEIHADLTFSEYQHIPIASLSKEINHQTVTCMSPTKSFNLAGLQVSYLITADEGKRKSLKDMFNSQGMFMINTMGITALEAAYQQGEEWLDGLLATVENHRDYVIDRFQNETDLVDIIKPEGTYLLWMDCRKMGLDQSELKKFMQSNAKVGLNDGVSFGEAGKGFMRMNIACPKATLEEGVDRIIHALQQYKG
ncbi:MalY/PatB family protein [Thalassobacillus pellis]|uniref:MalY/PatB family protein n=1 Tax=Thalassobacillus pellis TaxID=748008 RepID=UPI0019609959|nr:MalY/PatB family protein [Thalassobacillus pellis]MBM7554860.1 cystathionine beta-lyase [Thalassobacillus pellis]